MTFVQALDLVIEARLKDLEATVRRDLAATAGDADGAPAVDDPTWSRVEIEEVLVLEHRALLAWKQDVLSTMARFVGSSLDLPPVAGVH